MNKFTDDYIERLYAGWLGKIIGIRYGAPVEMWSSEDINAKFADVFGYLFDYPIFGADDDSNGPIFFFRTLEDVLDPGQLTPEDFGNTWLNYVPYLHGFFWWGGYRVSTEHTAYINLRNGLKAPKSGSIDTNSDVVAEQIGGQIFSDVWGLVSPYDFQKAAALAKMASQVSHDGEGVYGGMFLAACISSAFKADSIMEIIEDGLSVIPQRSGYYRMVRDLISFYEQKKGDAKACFAYIRDHYWTDKYPGNCHIIPNAAIIAYSLLYGEGDFDKTLRIANYSGFDTDCNVGNLGTILGVFSGIDKINYRKWRAPINDILLCSSVLGYENIVDIPSLIWRVAKMALRLAEAGYDGKYAGSLKHANLVFDFLLPGSTHGIRCSDSSVAMSNTSGRLHVHALKADTRLYYKTYYAKEDLYDNRYDTSMSPVVLPGQILKVRLLAPQGAKVSLYFKDQHSGISYDSPVKAVQGEAELAFVMDDVSDALISEIGLRVTENIPELDILSMEVTGEPSYRMNFAKEKLEDYTNTHQEISGTVYWNGKWELANGMLQGTSDELHGEIYAGIRMEDCHMASSFRLDKPGKAGLLFRVQGAARSYGVFADGQSLTLEKNANGYTVLQQTDFVLPIGSMIHVDIFIIKNRITVFVEGKKVLDFTDETPYRSGCFGAYVGKQSRATFLGFDINKGE